MLGENAQEYISNSSFFKGKQIAIIPLQEIENLGWTFLVMNKENRKKISCKNSER